MKFYICISFFLLSCLLGVCRTWTNPKGRSFKGELISSNEQQVTIKRDSDGHLFTLDKNMLSKADRDFIDQEAQKTAESGDLHNTSWAGKWNNERKFILTFTKNENTQNTYKAHHQWLEKNGSTSEEFISGRKKDDYYRFSCIHFFPEGNVAAASGDFREPYGFMTANLVKLPAGHPELQSLELEKYGWKKKDVVIPKVQSDLHKSRAHNLMKKADESDKNLLDNGGFDKGSSNWQGSFKAEDENIGTNNQVIRIETDRKTNSFSQKVKVGKAHKVTLSYDIRCSSDFVGDGLEIRFTRDDNTYNYYTFNKLPNSWKTRSLEFDKIEGSKKIEVTFELKTSARGYVRFDNISLIEK